MAVLVLSPPNAVLPAMAAAWTTTVAPSNHRNSLRPRSGSAIEGPIPTLRQPYFYSTAAGAAAASSRSSSSSSSPLSSRTRKQQLPPLELFALRAEQPPPPQRRRWGRFRIGKENGFGTVAAASSSSASGGVGSGFRWTLARAAQALVVFLMAGIAEIGGGWLVWKAVREGKPWWWALAGSLVLVLYGFIPTLQPTDSFGRVYAVYGGFFIALSYAWGWRFDAMRPDLGDIVGGSLALAGVLVILFWPRR